MSCKIIVCDTGRDEYKIPTWVYGAIDPDDVEAICDAVAQYVIDSGWAERRCRPHEAWITVFVEDDDEIYASACLA